MRSTTSLMVGAGKTCRSKAAAQALHSFDIGMVCEQFVRVADRRPSSRHDNTVDCGGSGHAGKWWRLTRVVMLVANNVYTDTRVKKEALAVSRMGLEVTILGLSDTGQQSVSMLGPVRIVRVRIGYVLRERRKQRRAQRRRYRPPFPGYRGDSANAARLRLKVRRSDVSAKRRRARVEVRRGVTSVAGAISALVMCGRNLEFRIRVAAGHRLDRGLSKAWRLWDGGLSGVSIGARWRKSCRRCTTSSLRSRLRLMKSVHMSYMHTTCR